MVSDRLFKPSRKIGSQGDRFRASLLSIILLVRVGLLVPIYGFVLLSDNERLRTITGAIYLAAASNLLAFLLSRTRHFRVAAFIGVTDSVIAIPLVCYQNPSPEVLYSAPYWYAFGPLMGSLVLPTRFVVWVTIASAASFVSISLFAQPEFLPTLGAALVHFSYVSTLVLIGCLFRADLGRG